MMSNTTTTNNNNSTNKEIHTAVSLTLESLSSSSSSGDLEKPLLAKESSSSEERNLSKINANIDGNVDMSTLNTAFRWHGLVIGFLCQIINVSGTTYMHYRWGSVDTDTIDTDTDTDNETNVLLEQIFHGLIWLITQVDLYLYVFMWVSLTAILTSTGMNHVRTEYFGGPGQHTPDKRSIFVLGVQFYVGVVIGVFLAWAGIDFFLGLPVPLAPMVAVLVFGLFISYTMVWCYDLEDQKEDDNENDFERQQGNINVKAPEMVEA